MDLSDLNKVWETKVLKKPDSEKARCILDHIVKQVQPIMRRHKWKVKLLSEFCPANPSLMGLNIGGGVEVKLRLRRPNKDWDFFPFEQVLDTMLHELCHIVHGPHNAIFYKLWDELRKECEELIAKGITGTGQGFDAPGRRLGGVSRQPPLSSLRQTALAAAEKRARVGSLLPSGPKRIGGNNDIMTALSPIQAAAMAAERRMYDDLWCGSVSDELINMVEGSKSTPSHPESSEYIGLSVTSYEGQGKDFMTGVDSGNVKGVDGLNCHNARKRNISDHLSGGTSISASTSSYNQKDDGEKDRAIWECSICTLFNEPLALICEACGAQKPEAAVSRYKTWACKFCTLKNSIKLEKCSACEQWRYSSGPPVYHAPNCDT